MEPLEAVVVHLELPVHQDRHAVRLGEVVDPLHLGRVALDAELLLGNDNRPRWFRYRSISRVAPSASGTSLAPKANARAWALANRAHASLPSACASSPFEAPSCVDGVFIGRPAGSRIVVVAPRAR